MSDLIWSGGPSGMNLDEEWGWGLSLQEDGPLP